MFGFLKGRIEVMIDNPVVLAGDKIKGKIKLIVKKPYTSKSLYVRLYMQITKKTMSISKSGVSVGTQSSTEDNYAIAEKMIESEKYYTPGEYEIPFEILAPQDSQIKLPGFLGNTLSMLAGIPQRRYYLDIRSKISWLSSISKTVNISINNPPNNVANY